MNNPLTEGFMVALRKKFPGASFDTTDLSYLRICVKRPDDWSEKREMTAILAHLGSTHGYEFDGYDEDGYPCVLI
jgi:hypothetical protein